MEQAKLPHQTRLYGPGKAAIAGFVNALYTGGLFNCYMLDESICHFKGVESYFVALILVLMENPVSKHCRP